MTNFWKLAAISAVLAGVAVATTESTATRTSGSVPGLRGTAELGSLRCDEMGSWPFFEARCSPDVVARRAVRTVGLDPVSDRSGPLRVTEIAGPIVR